MGAHIDGFIAVVAHTIVVGISKENPATGRKADVILAAYWAGQAALRLLKASNGVCILFIYYKIIIIIFVNSLFITKFCKHNF